MNGLTIERTKQLSGVVPRERFEPQGVEKSELVLIATIAFTCFYLICRLAGPSKLKIAACSVGSGMVATVFYGVYRDEILGWWNGSFDSKKRYEYDLTKQFNEHQLRGDLLRRLCLLKTDSLKLSALAEMNFAQLTEARMALGKERFRAFLQTLPELQLPHQLWLGIDEFMVSDLVRMGQLLELQRKNASCDWFREYTSALAGELTAPMHQDILRRLKEIAPHLIIVSPYETMRADSPEESATIRRVARHCQLLPFSESLDEWLADLKFAAAKNDPNALIKIEKNFDQLNIPFTFEFLKKIVQGYIDAKYNSPLLQQFKRELVKLYYAETSLEYDFQTYRFACRYECSELKQRICENLKIRPRPRDYSSEFIIMLGENEDVETFRGFQRAFQLSHDTFRKVYAHFIQKDTPTARHIITWLTNLFWSSYTDAERFKMYAPHEMPIGLLPPVAN